MLINTSVFCTSSVDSKIHANDPDEIFVDSLCVYVVLVSLCVGINVSLNTPRKHRSVKISLLQVAKKHQSPRLICVCVCE